MHKFGTEVLVRFLDRINEHNPNLTHLALNNFRMKPLDAEFLAAALQRNSYITSLDLKFNRLRAEGAKLIAEVTTLKVLDISGNKIGDEGAEALARNFHLTSLTVTLCSRIGFVGVTALAKNTTLKELDLGGNHIGDGGAQALAENTTLRTLGLQSCGLSLLGIAVLLKNTTLTSLSLGYNDLKNEGAILLASSTTLFSLSLMANRIGFQGIKALAQNTNLTSLNLTRNNFVPELGDSSTAAEEMTKQRAVLDVFGFLAANRNLWSINLTETGVRDEHIVTLAQSSSLTRIDLSYSFVSSRGLSALAENTQLASLCFLDCNTQDRVLTAIFENNINLTTFDFGYSTNQTTGYSYKKAPELQKIATLNKKAKELQFIETVIEVAKSKRELQTSIFQFLPPELIVYILTYVAGNTLRKRESVVKTCIFLLETIGTSTEGNLNWSVSVSTSLFFKKWQQPDYDEVKSRYPKAPVVDQNAQAVRQKEEDKEWRRANRSVK